MPADRRDSGQRPARPARPARAELAAELRRIRTDAGRTTRQIGTYTSGHISPVERGLVTPSWDLVREYVKLGGDHTVLRELYARALEEGRQRRTDRISAGHPVLDLPPRTADDGTTTDEVRRHYRVTRRDETYRFGPDGVVRQVRCTCWLTARTAGVVLYGCRHTYDADQRPGVLRLAAAEGCTPDHLHEGPTGTLRAFLRLDRELGPDDTDEYRLGYRLTVTSSIRTHPRLLFHAGGETHRYTVRALFVPPSLPTEVWSFAAPNEIAAQDPAPQNRLPPDRGGRYACSFEHVVDGWCYGLGWSW